MKIRRLFFLLLSLLMILGMGSQQTLAQDELDFEGQIAYVGTDGNIWVRLGGGDSAFPVTYDASESKRYASPRWSPDGLKLAYCQLNSQDGGGGQLYVSRSGEWQPFLLTEDLYCKSMPGGSLSWS
ncbi:MAG: PD40 domain-containing protein, partial [Anaerolineales bacterium]|nr:PD40 domain-containing protein [Anaerolineales bacterium]